MLYRSVFELLSAQNQFSPNLALPATFTHYTPSPAVKARRPRLMPLNWFSARKWIQVCCLFQVSLMKTLWFGFSCFFPHHSPHPPVSSTRSVMSRIGRQRDSRSSKRFWVSAGEGDVCINATKFGGKSKNYTLRFEGKIRKLIRKTARSVLRPNSMFEAPIISNAALANFCYKRNHTFALYFCLQLSRGREKNPPKITMTLKFYETYSQTHTDTIENPYLIWAFPLCVSVQKKRERLDQNLLRYMHSSGMFAVD